MTVSEDQVHTITEEAARGAKRSTARKVVLGLTVACLVFMVLTIVLAWKLLYKPTQQQAQAGTDLAALVQQSCEDPKQDTATLKRLCENADTVVSEAPNTVQGPKGDAGEIGPAPSDAAVANAVALYCSERGACRGNRGDSVTQAQVAEAVASYCDANGSCRGLGGAAGSAGQDGAAGTQGERGETGSGPSDQQVASAVASYCSTRNDCQGPAGTKGEPGQDGQDGSPGDTVDGGSCEFTGIGTVTITIQTSTGPTTFECVGSPLGGGTQ